MNGTFCEFIIFGRPENGKVKHSHHTFTSSIWKQLFVRVRLVRIPFDTRVALRYH